jgi:hypothetical protein
MLNVIASIVPRLVAGAIGGVQRDLQTFVRRAALRTTCMTLAIVALSVFLVMAAMAGYLALSAAYSPPLAAAIVALVCLATGGILALVALKASFRDPSAGPVTSAEVREATRDMERVADDAARMGEDIHALIGRNSGSLVLAALAAGVVYTMFTERK